jgi:hypothetical protein
MAQGYKSTMKMALEQSFGVAKGSPTYNWLHLREEGIADDRNSLISSALTGVSATRAAGPGVFKAEGALNIEVGPEGMSQLFYAVMGYVYSTESLPSSTPKAYIHQYTFADVVPSFEIYHDLTLASGGNTVVRHLTGCTADSMTFTGSMADFITASVNVRAAKDGVKAMAMGASAYSGLTGFVPTIGSMSIDTVDFTDADNFNLTISRNSAYRPKWGSQFIMGAAPGRPVVELSWDLFFSTETELKRFFGNKDAVLSAELNPLDALQSANVVILSKNGGKVGTTPSYDYQLKFIMPKLVYQRMGAFVKGEDAIRQPMTGYALYDTGISSSLMIELVNSQSVVNV